jgi:hypothetical protein
MNKILYIGATSVFAFTLAQSASAICFAGYGNTCEGNRQNGSIHHNTVNMGGDDVTNNIGNKNNVHNNNHVNNHNNNNVKNSNNNKISNDVDVTNNVHNSVDASSRVSNDVRQDQKQKQAQGQDQRQVQEQRANNEGVNVEVAGDNVNYEAPDLSDMPGVPGDVTILGACSASGLSGSMPGMGVSLGATHPACLLFDAAIIALEIGDKDHARALLKEAYSITWRERWYAKYVSWIPLVGKFF